MKTAIRPSPSRESVPNLPWSFQPNSDDIVFVLGLAHTTWPIRDPKLPKDWPIAYKIVRWYRLNVSKQATAAYREKMSTAHIQQSVAAIKEEKARGAIRSVCKILVVDDPHGRNAITVIDL